MAHGNILLPPSIMLSFHLGEFKVTFAYGTTLVGFGKGTFKDGNDGCVSAVDESAKLMYELDVNTYGQLDNKVALITDILDMEVKAKSDGAKMCYFKTSKGPDGIWTFTEDGTSLFQHDHATCF